MSLDGIGEPIPIRKTRKEKIIDFFSHRTGVLSIGIPSALAILLWVLPFFGIYPQTSPIEEKTFNPDISIDFRNEDGLYSSKIIDLNVQPFEIVNAILVKAHVPHEGNISVSIENYTLTKQYNPKYFEITEYPSFRTEVFGVNSGYVEHPVTIRMHPIIKTVDNEYIMSLNSHGTCTAPFIKVFYRIAYHDIIKNSTTTFFPSEPFSGQWELRTSTRCPFP